MITYLTLGPGSAPGPTVSVQRCAPNISSMYRARNFALQEVDSEFFVWADCGEDSFSANWDVVLSKMLAALQATGSAIAYCDETRDGTRVDSGSWAFEKFCANPTMLHHAVVCRTSALRDANLPKTGCFNWETLAYGHLAKSGACYVPEVGYHWNPTPKGAHTWADTQRGMTNSLLYLQGRTGVHFESELS